jgi:hypothetical protein
MKKLRLLFLLLLAMPAAAFAERLHFDHRLYPSLKAVFDNDRDEMIAYDNSNPKYVIDRIAIQGKSATDWTEAFDIVVRTPSKKIATAEDWLAEIKAKVGKSCASEFSIIAQDTNSLTFSRRSTDCGPDKVQFALYRIVKGERNLFMLNAINRGDMENQKRQQWLALLASARLEN